EYRVGVACRCFYFFFSSRRRHTRFSRDWSSDVCSSDLNPQARFILGRILFNLENYPAAKTELEAATALNADFDTGYLLGKTYLRSEERRVGKECRYQWARDE